MDVESKWDAEVVEHAAVAKIDANAFQKTKTLNFISRSANLSGLQNVTTNGFCLMQHGCVLRADMAKIAMGKFCYVGKKTVLRPPSGVGPMGFLPMTIGDFVILGGLLFKKGCFPFFQKTL
jgi:carbonic anhydrase/acetyltransferase-like protein (isoleucine patch superfamily)